MPMLLAVSTLLAVAAPTDSVLVREFSALLRNAPIERLEAHAALPTVSDVLLTDLDADGNLEAIVSIRPTLRQTPTLLVYRRAGTGPWERVREGLAPGRLRPVSGRLVDTHVHRVGMDLVAGDGSPATNQRVLNAGAAQGMSLVAYPGFLHADMRIGTTLLVDLSNWTLPAGANDTCESFEFSQPERVVAGRLEGGGDASYVVALTEEDLTVYHITAITPEGRLRLRSTLLPRPAGVTGLARSDDGRVVVMQGARRTVLHTVADTTALRIDLRPESPR